MCWFGLALESSADLGIDHMRLLAYAVPIISRKRPGIRCLTLVFRPLFAMVLRFRLRLRVLLALVALCVVLGFAIIRVLLFLVRPTPPPRFGLLSHLVQLWPSLWSLESSSCVSVGCASTCLFMFSVACSS